MKLLKDVNYLFHMSANKIRPRCKKIDMSAKHYHHFEYSVSEFGLFDDADDGTPIVIGSRNLVDATIRNLPKRITIFYYKKNGVGFWEKKAIYNGKEQSTLELKEETKKETKKEEE